MSVIVVIASRDEARRRDASAPPRPLMILERRPGGRIVMVARNDEVVLRADDGGQCDPFTDGGGAIRVEGVHLTVENGVACGQHWIDFVTFRFDAAFGMFVFDNQRRKSWSLNPSGAPGADAMLRDGPPHLVRARRDRPITLLA